jgi:glucuronokinase
MHIIRQSACARAALVGNPSDGYHGRTISVILRNFQAKVTLYEWERIELLWSQEDQSRFDSVKDLVQDVKLHGYYGGIRLIKATIKRFAEFCADRRREGQTGYELHDGKFSIRYETAVPRQVGMAGSSAIVVATLRALMEFYQIDIPRPVLPSLALGVERDELGIGAGLQDRVIQVYEGLVFMDFTGEKTSSNCGYECGSYEPLDPGLLPPLYVAYARELAEPGERTHNPLRERYRLGERAVVDGMREVADYAAQAREAILRGDHQVLAELMDENFEVRRRICSLDANHLHVRMVDTARRLGASANFTGSGGAIIGVYEGEAMFRELEEELGKLNCAVTKPIIV